MTSSHRSRMAAFILLAVAGLAQSQSPSATSTENRVTNRIKGIFDVKLAPQTDPAAPISRMSIDKVFHGELDATSKGDMLALMTETKGSAGYVAMERVTGKLRGASGSFALQHSGTMERGAPTLSVTVVPDSGTGELRGIAGTMKIDITDGKHFYDFEYSLPKP